MFNWLQQSPLNTDVSISLIMSATWFKHKTYLGRIGKDQFMLPQTWWEIVVMSRQIYSYWFPLTRLKTILNSR